MSSHSPRLLSSSSPCLLSSLPHISCHPIPHVLSSYSPCLCHPLPRVSCHLLVHIPMSDCLFTFLSPVSDSVSIRTGVWGPLTASPSTYSPDKLPLITGEMSTSDHNIQMERTSPCSCYCRMYLHLKIYRRNC